MSKHPRVVLLTTLALVLHHLVLHSCALEPTDLSFKEPNDAVLYESRLTNATHVSLASPRSAAESASFKAPENWHSSSFPTRSRKLARNQVLQLGMANKMTCAMVGVSMPGRLYCWGNYYYGELGHGKAGSTLDERAPVPVCQEGDQGSCSGTGLPSGGAWAASGGIQFMCAIASDRDVYCWGTGYKLGIGITSSATYSRPQPVCVAGSTTNSCTGSSTLPSNLALSIAAGSSHACVIYGASLPGKVACWGTASGGQLGDNSTAYMYQATSPCIVGKISATCTGSEGLPDGNLVLSIAAYEHATCVIVGTALPGTPFCFGQQKSGRLGTGEYTATYALPKAVCFAGENTAPCNGGSTLPTGGVHAIAIGSNVGCFIGSDKRVYCAGSSSYSAIGRTSASSSPVAVCLSDNVGGCSGGLMPPEDVAAISGGESFMCALLASTSDTYCWGMSHGGTKQHGLSRAVCRQGDGAPCTGASKLPAGDVSIISAGSNYLCLVTQSSGAALCAGDNADGELGRGSIPGTSHEPLPVDSIAWLKPVNANATVVGKTCMSNIAGHNAWLNITFDTVVDTSLLNTPGITIDGSPLPFEVLSGPKSFVLLPITLSVGTVTVSLTNNFLLSPLAFDTLPIDAVSTFVQPSMCPTSLPSISPSPSWSASPLVSASITVTASANTTISPTVSQSPSASANATSAATASQSPSASANATSAATASQSPSAFTTPSMSAFATASPSLSFTASSIASPMSTPSLSSSASSSPSNSRSSSPEASLSVSPAASPTSVGSPFSQITALATPSNFATMSALATRGVTSSPVASTSVSPALSSSAAPSVAVAVVSPVSPGASASTSPAPLPLFLEASGAIELIAEPPARTLKTGTQLTVSRVDASVFVLSSQVWCSPALASSVPKTTLWQGRRVVVQQLTLLVDVDSRQLSEGVHTALITVRAVLDSNSVSVLIPVQVDVRAAQVQVAFSGDAVAAVGTSVVSVLSLMNRGTGAALVQIRVLPGATQQPGQVHHRGNLLLNDSTHGFQSTAGDRKITVALQGGTAVRIQALAPGSSLQPLREGRYAANVEISANVPILSVSDTVSIDSDNEQRAVVLWRVRAAALFVYPSRARRLMRSGREASLPTQLYTLRSELSVRARLNSTAARASLYDAGMPAIFPPAQPPWTVHQLVRSFSQPQHTMAMFNSSSLNALLELRAWSSTPGRPLTLDTSTYAMTVMPGSACAQDSIWRLATRNALPPQSAWPVRTPLRVEIFLQDCGGFATDQLPAQAGLSAVLQPYDSQLSVQYSDVLVVAGTTGMRRAEFSPAQLGAFNLQLLLGSSPLTAEGWLTADTVLSIVPPQCLRSEFLQRSARGDQCECVPGAGRREISGQPLWASPCDSCVAGSFSYRREDLQDHLCVRCPSGTFSPAQHATACIRCPQGAACTNGLLTILDGYYVTADTDWRRPHTIRLLSCVHPAACKAPAANAIARALHGNFTDTDADNLATQCMYGHTGTLCGTCTSGQVMGPQGCTPCHHTRNALWLSAVFSAIVAVIIVALLVRSLLKTLQAVEQTGTKDSAAPASYSFALMRIATNWLQTFATIALIPLPQPPAVRNSSSQVGATAELSPLSSDVIRCALQYDWATRWWLTLALYAGILVCLPLGALPVAAAARRWSNARNARFTSAQFASAVFVMTFSILFPPVLRQLLQPFEEYGELVDGTRVLRSDTAVTVEGHADLSGIRVFATIVLVMWVGMLPVAIFSALWCQRNTIRSLSSGNSCGASRGPRSKRHTSWARTVAYATAPLYSAYRVHGSGILFEALVLARGVLQVLIPVLLQHDPNAQAMWLAALFFLSALAQTILRPLQHAVLNRLSALTLASLAGTALAILAYATRIKQNDLLFSNDAAGSDKESQLPGSKDIAYLYASTIAVVNLLLAALLVWHLLRNVWKRARWIRVERRRRSSAAFGALSSGNARSTDNSNATPTNSSFLARAHRSQGGDPPEGLDCRDPQLGNAAICSVPISTHAAATGTQVAFKS